jgi:hypothetical protein
MLSPDRELNEQILQEMRDGGDDLSTVRPVYFQFAFPSCENAQKFAEVVVERRLLAEVSDAGDGPAPDLPWEVNVTIKLGPELTSISGHERDLGQLAAAHQGRGDGWFCERITQREA